MRIANCSVEIHYFLLHWSPYSLLSCTSDSIRSAAVVVPFRGVQVTSVNERVTGESPAGENCIFHRRLCVRSPQSLLSCYPCAEYLKAGARPSAILSPQILIMEPATTDSYTHTHTHLSKMRSSFLLLDVQTVVSQRELRPGHGMSRSRHAVTGSNEREQTPTP